MTTRSSTVGFAASTPSRRGVAAARAQARRDSGSPRWCRSSARMRSRSSAARSNSSAGRGARASPSQSRSIARGISSASGQYSSALGDGSAAVDVVGVGDRDQRLGDRLLDRLRRDAVLLVVAPAGWRAGGRSRRSPCCIESVIVSAYRMTRAVDVARGAADRLDQRARRAQEAFLVGVEDRDQRDLGQVEPLAQQVDADQHVEVAAAQVADDLDALDRLDVGVEVAHLDAEVLEVVGQVLGHLLGERRDEHALVALDAAADLVEQVVDLVRAPAAPRSRDR